MLGCTKGIFMLKMRVKIINSLSQGLPIVSTSVGVEGIEAKDNLHLLIRDDPKAFAEVLGAIPDAPETESDKI